jgi:hypothetical protein
MDGPRASEEDSQITGGWWTTRCLTGLTICCAGAAIALLRGVKSSPRLRRLSVAFDGTAGTVRGETVIRVTSLELDYPGDGVTYFGGKQFTGFEVFRDDSGWECAEHEYRDGLLSGVKREWHWPGVLALEAECALGGFQGRVRRWQAGCQPLRR